MTHRLDKVQQRAGQSMVSPVVLLPSGRCSLASSLSGILGLASATTGTGDAVAAAAAAITSCPVNTHHELGGLGNCYTWAAWQVALTCKGRVVSKCEYTSAHRVCRHHP